MRVLIIICLAVVAAANQPTKPLESDEKWKMFLADVEKVDSKDSYFVNNLIEVLKLLKKTSSYQGGSGGEYLGCYQDYTLQRMFRGFAKPDKNHMTLESCMNICKIFGFVYFGTQAGADCHCGDSAPEPAYNPKVTENLCNEPCKGNQTQICGGYYTMSVYRTGIEQYRFLGNKTVGESTSYSEIKWKMDV